MRPIRILGPGVTLALALPLSAQMHHVDKSQRVTRAVGVYEWTGDMLKPDAARLIPVSIFINNHFEDAGVFLAQPIPLALETGNVYSIQHSGDLIGSLDLDFARDIVDKRSTADDNPLGAWYGYGRFIPLSAAPPPPKLTQHSATPAVVVGSEDDSRPHFVASRNPSDNSSTTTPAKGSSTSGTSATPDDPDRPQMKRRDSDSATTDNAPLSPGTDAQGTAQGTGDVPPDDPDRPTLGHRNVPDNKKQKKQKDSGSGVEAMPTSLNEDPDRPEIHRGKVESATAPPQLTGVPGNLHQAVAVSDAANNPPHVFAREWEASTERAATLADMQKLAQPLVRQYLTANHLEAAPVTASTSASSGPKLNTAPATASKSAATTHSATTHSSHHALDYGPLNYGPLDLASRHDGSSRRSAHLRGRADLRLHPQLRRPAHLRLLRRARHHHWPARARHHHRPAPSRRRPPDLALLGHRRRPPRPYPLDAPRRRRRPRRLPPRQPSLRAPRTQQPPVRPLLPRLRPGPANLRHRRHRIAMLDTGFKLKIGKEPGTPPGFVVLAP